MSDAQAHAPGAASPEDGNAPAPRDSLPLSRKVLFIGIIWVALVLLFELGARIVFFVRDDFNPYYLKFGFIPEVEYTSSDRDGYAKFRPNAARHQKLGPETISIRINGNGFRSDYDFAAPKPAGVFRIAALGASSTFGYSNRDHETYPYQLERLLREAYPDLTIEVLNLGIPEARLENLVALARTEFPGLQPDVVTLYSGANNATRDKPRDEAGVVYRVKDWFAFHSVAWSALHPLLLNVYYRVVKTFNRNVAGAPNLGIPVQLTPEQVERLRGSLRGSYRAQVETLADYVDSIGATLVPITQGYTLYKMERFRLREGGWRTYAGEVAFVDSMMARDGGLLAPHATMLIHNDLMNELRDLAADRGLPLVEGIAVLDDGREHMMASWVHVTPPGNGRLAAAIQDVLAADGLLPGSPPMPHAVTRAP